MPNNAGDVMTTPAQTNDELARLLALATAEVDDLRTRLREASARGERLALEVRAARRERDHAVRERDDARREAESLSGRLAESQRELAERRDCLAQVASALDRIQGVGDVRLAMARARAEQAQKEYERMLPPPPPPPPPPPS